MYEYDVNKKITQGTILKELEIDLSDEKRLTLSKSIIISQSCDIEHSLNNFNLPSIMLLPMYECEFVIDGSYIEGNTMSPIQGNTKKKLLKDNELARFHYFGENLKLKALVIDFKRYYTFEKNFILDQAQRYVATLVTLHRELLSQRFCNYLGRIGLE